MGLDMYLSAEKYISGYDHSASAERSRFENVLKAAGMTGQQAPQPQSLTISLTVGYWRKADAIHKWFVETVQDGKDECQKSSVSREQLQELLELCHKVQDTKDYTLLPPSEGLFFGETGVEEWYWDCLANTVEILNRVLTVDTLDGMADGNGPLGSCDFSYQASW